MLMEYFPGDSQCAQRSCRLLASWPRLDSWASDLSKFESRVGKSAPFDVDVTPPVVCVCKDGGAFQNKAGRLLSVIVDEGTKADPISFVGR